MIDFENDSVEEEKLGPSDSQLQEISVITNNLLVLQKRIANGTKYLAELAKQATKIETDTLPDALKRAGVASFTMPSGEGISIKDTIVTNIKKADKPLAYKWMNDNGFGSLVKTKIVLNFGMGEKERADELLKYLNDNNFDFGSSQDIHAATLKKWGTDALESGLSTPETIKIDSFPKAIITK